MDTFATDQAGLRACIELAHTRVEELKGPTSDDSLACDGDIRFDIHADAR